MLSRAREPAEKRAALSLANVRNAPERKLCAVIGIIPSPNLTDRTATRLTERKGQRKEDRSFCFISSALSSFSFGVVDLAKGPPVLGSLARSTTSTPVLCLDRAQVGNPVLFQKPNENGCHKGTRFTGFRKISSARFSLRTGRQLSAAPRMELTRIQAESTATLFLSVQFR